MRAVRFAVHLAGVFGMMACVDSIPTSPGISPGVVQSAPSATFTDDFASPTLDAAWTVVDNPAGYPFGADNNSYSLTANPGYLRYSVNLMTHHEGFLNSYQPASYSCCTHYPGVELHRPISGDWWRLETRAEYFMPSSANGRVQDIRVYFGDGTPGTVFANLHRTEDCCSGPTEPTHLQLAVRVPGEVLGYPLRNILETVPVTDNPAGDIYYWRLERAGSVLTSSWSYDGITWVQAFSRDMGTALNGLGQRVVISGLSWFVPANSYADYAYVNVIPTTLAVGIDIKPGSTTNPINLRKQGKVPVAILSTATFNAPVDVDRTTLTFGRAGTENSFSHCEPTAVDVNGDSRLDLVCNFEVTLTQLVLGDVSATLKGRTTTKRPISGSDVINAK